MAKLRIELEPNEWQVLLALVGQGYNGVIARISEQLNAQANLAPAPRPAANGEDKSAEQPPVQ